MAGLVNIESKINGFILQAKANKDVVVRLGEAGEQILEVVQQNDDDDSKFTPELVTQILQGGDASLNSVADKKTTRIGKALLTCVEGANKKIKLAFAFALFAVAPQLINDIAPDLYKEVSENATEEYLTVGGGRLQKNAFKRRLKAFLSSVKKKETFAFVTLGKAGAGKSTFINSLIGSKEAPVDESIDSDTPTSASYNLLDNDLPVEVKMWDTPGLQDDIEGSVKKIAEQVKGKVNLLVFCIDITNPRHKQELLKIISTVSNSFDEGPDIWKCSMFVLTKANLLRAASDSDDLEHFRTAVAKLRDGCKKLLKQKEYKIPLDVVDRIPFVPVGSHRDRHLANGEPWYPEFWTTAIERATDAGKALLLLMNENRLNKGGDGLELNDAQKKRVVEVVKPVLSPTAAVVLAVTSVGVGAIIGGIAGLAFGPPGIAVGAGVGAFVGGLFGFGVGKKLS